MLKRLFIAVATVSPFLFFSVGSHVVTGGSYFEPGDQTNAPGSTSTSAFEMTCDASAAYDQCVEYSFDNQEDFDSAWNDCGFTVSEGHTCSRGGSSTKTCEHTNSDATTCSVIYNAPDNTDQICTNNGGRPDC